LKKATVNIVIKVLIISILACLSVSSVLAADTTITRTLKIGMSGDDVAAVQQLLKDLGYYNYSKITGYFGTITDEAVKSFQKANGLAVDGIIGPATREVINKLLMQASSETYTVQPGDTMWKISQRFGVSLDALLRENGMTDGTIIYVGQKIYIPQNKNESNSQVHIVQPGDTMWKISQKYRVSLEALLYVNGMKDGSLIYVGQKVYIPSTTGSKPYIRYISHVVAKGEYLWLLSYKYGVPVEEIADANGITTSTVLYEGQTIKIPQHVVPVKSTPGPKYGELLDWWTEAQYVFPLGAVATVEDFETGICYNVKRTYGSGHADVEPLTAQDTKTMLSIWENHERLWDGSVNYWARRPVIIHIGGRKLAASATGMFHAGVDSVPEGEYASWRSGGYGPGTNFDSIKGNGADGHSDIHFLNSVRHKDSQTDEQHQAKIMVAAGK